MKHSAGILVYKKSTKGLEILLCHMGGPYWENIDYGGWSIPKGENNNEKIIDTAVREFYEETGFKVIKENLNFLGSKKQNSNKLITIFYTSQDFDTAKAISNNFKIEWPKGSKKIKEFPENDKTEWVGINEAKKKILKGQLYFLKKLEKVLME